MKLREKIKDTGELTLLQKKAIILKLNRQYEAIKSDISLVEKINNLNPIVKQKLIKRLAAEQIEKLILKTESLKKRLSMLPIDKQNSIIIKFEEILSIMEREIS